MQAVAERGARQQEDHGGAERRAEHGEGGAEQGAEEEPADQGEERRTRDRGADQDDIEDDEGERRRDAMLHDLVQQEFAVPRQRLQRHVVVEAEAEERRQRQRDRQQQPGAAQGRLARAGLCHAAPKLSGKEGDGRC